jgi:CheY-like chemotaxis protein
MKALIAEDELCLANNVKRFLEQEEFGLDRFDVVDVVGNGAAALQLIDNEYDVVILDIILPEVYGTHVIEALNRVPPHKRPRVVLITAYPGVLETARIAVKMGVHALLRKPFELPDLIEVIRELLASRRQLLDLERRNARPQCHWALTLSEEGGTAFIQVRGRLNYASSCTSPWTKWDSLSLGHLADITGEMLRSSGPFHHYWISQAKITGTNLFERLFVGNIQQSYIAAGNAVLHGHDLHLTFVGPRQSLRLPLEFLNDGVDYLVLRHPMRRVATGIHSRGNTNLSSLLAELAEKREKLRVLLVASSTEPRIDGVDEEVAALYERLKGIARERCTIDYLPSERATYDEMVSRLKDCRYHVLHYAGHGYHDIRSPEKSSLFFWEKQGRSGNVKALSVDTLKNALRLKGHDLRFVYLSCCSGAATSDESKLLSDDFLGLADGLIATSVPAVLGFRWPVSDVGAMKMALSFYTSLFDQGELDAALFDARCEFAGSDDSSGAGDWLSPILIAQG